MRLLMIHADRFAFSVTSEAITTGYSAALDDSPRQADIEELLVAFISVESGDNADSVDVAGQAVAAINNNARNIDSRRIMVYPYAHLASDLAPPRIAFDVVNRVYSGLAAYGDLEVQRAPFGFYKSFEIACKGHPLSESARTIIPSSKQKTADQQHESKAIAAEKKLNSEWRVYQSDGSFMQAADFDFTDQAGLSQLYSYESEGTREVEEAPPHIKLMREQELVGYEPASDTGNLRWYPKGILVKRLLERHVTDMVINYGAMEVETPIMYDYGHPALAKYLDRFPARQYVVNSDSKEYFLRFAACFGQYMILHDMVASYRDLPVRLYELTHYSFRREQGGEVAGLRRLRAFTMPDMHSVVRDMSMAKAEFLNQVRLCLQWLDDIGVDCVPVIRFVRSFLDEHPEFITELTKILGRPALVEIWDERFFYFVAKFEMNFIDSAGKAACLSTVQIDVENAERFDISYTAEDGSRQQPLILHTSVSGSVDRNLYAILESQAMQIAIGEKAEWPVWLAPIQVRLLPVSEQYVERAQEIARQIPFPVDVDNRDLKLGKKVREAEQEWIPYTVVIGAREIADGALLNVRLRTGNQIEMTVDELIQHLHDATVGKPAMLANTPLLLDRRPIFAG